MKQYRDLWSFLLAGTLALAVAPWRSQAGSDPEILTNTSSSQRSAFAEGLDQFEEQEHLHDGPARTITQAIEAHGGEAAGTKVRYQDISASDRSALLAFLGSL